MSQPAARPWWADVQHLRPTADGEPAPTATEDATAGEPRFPARLRPSTAELRLVSSPREGDAGARASDGSRRRAGDGQRGTGASHDDEHRSTGRGRFLRKGAGTSTRERDRPAREDEAGPAASDEAPSGRFARARPSLTGRFARPASSTSPPRPAPAPAVRPAPEPAARPAPAPASHPTARFAPRPDPALTGTRARAATPRRTVQIRGNVEPHREQQERWESSATGPVRRRGKRPQERVGARPDRIALYAVLLGVLLILVAVLSASSARAATGPTSLGDRTLKAGMVGRDVRHLQLRLRRLGLLRASATARFGPLTRRAVRRYQRSRCLAADGVAGPATVRALRGHRRACRRGAAGRRRAARRSSARRATYRAVPLGTRTLARGMRGNDVRTLQRLLGIADDGVFGPGTARAVRALQRSAGLAADGKVGPATRAALAARRMSTRTATWYGPGLYGNRTACGHEMTRRLRGVAHKHLPCGARVVLHHGGRFVVARVVDRGPYADGVTFDLTAATARQLGLSTTAAIRARY